MPTPPGTGLPQTESFLLGDWRVHPLQNRIESLSSGEVRRLEPKVMDVLRSLAARAVYDAQQELSLRYFGPVADAPGFPRALARTLEELALAGVTSPRLTGAGEGASDLAALLERFEAQFEAAFVSLAHDQRAVDRTLTAARESAGG